MIKNGYVRPHKQRRVWAKHDVDQGFYRGARHKTRGNAPIMPHKGRAVDFAHLAAHQFLEGFGLYVQREHPNHWRVVEPVQGTIGYADCHTALGYRDAAAQKGITLEVYQP